MNILQIIKNLKPLPRDKHLTSFVSSDVKERIDIKYFFDNESGHFYAQVIFGQLSQGPPRHVHGGAIAAVLDEAMGAVAWMNDFTAMTVNLEVQYYKSLKLETMAYVETWVDRNEEKKVYVKGILASADDSLYAEANSLFIRQSKERFQSMGDIPDYLFQGYTLKKND